MKKRILVTGGAGFIGYHLCRHLLSRGDCKIDIIDNLSRGSMDRDLSLLLKNRDAAFTRIDLADGGSFGRMKQRYDHIYHLAAVIGVDNVRNDPVGTLHTNTVAALNLLKWIHERQKRVKGVLFSSTSEVYTGTSKHYGVKVPTDEKVNLCLEGIESARATYSLSKMVGESACLNYFRMYKLPATVVRFHNVYGPRMGYSHVIPELMSRAKKGGSFLDVYSPGHTRAFCYVSDAVRGMVALMSEKRARGHIFNIGDDSEEIAMKSLAARISDLVHPGLKIRPRPATPGSVERRCPDIRKIRNFAGYDPKVRLKEGLELTWQWYRKNTR
jgi:nucleoside-diphosphate-sugar epimerase